MHPPLARPLILTLLLTSGQAVAASAPSQGMEVTGDQELPKVLYIVPWKVPQPARINPPELDSPLDRPATPCDLGLNSPHWNCPEIQKAAKP
ncbi:hypothetical protein [Aestuariirhabdus litorea]|uniref:Uncharacterized protein n=1 Tax=Aestuariirhabdus litorea TaxID=2528527 RepID=A0A3P3VNE0_9GAMM|nr:hypothetical protein [Aestuariirhabdus litorea]RRJ84271.1 hypothetical protein D0544_03960 [Aestuariirhabdus litorea]RWW97493.1 hypothetical protein DZC74_03960 [Endozoicomonadaceae bacterium GTF-13]